MLRIEEINDYNKLGLLSCKWNTLLKMSEIDNVFLTWE